MCRTPRKTDGTTFSNLLQEKTARLLDVVVRKVQKTFLVFPPCGCINAWLYCFKTNYWWLTGVGSGLLEAARTRLRLLRKRWPPNHPALKDLIEAGCWYYRAIMQGHLHGNPSQAHLWLWYCSRKLVWFNILADRWQMSSHLLTLKLFYLRY